MKIRLSILLLCFILIWGNVIAQEDIYLQQQPGDGISVSDSLMLQGKADDPLFLIKGKIAGASVSRSGGHPGTTNNMIIRGLSSIYFSQNPVYIVDGIIGVDISMIHPDEIFSMEVLNNISSSARYGNLGGNGVVIIKTKSAEFNKPFSLTYKSNISFDQPTNTYDLLSADGIRDYAQEMQNPWHPFSDGGADVNYQDEIFRNTASHSHYLSGSGIVKNTNYLASFSYKNQPGLVEQSGSERIGGNIKLTQSFLEDKLLIRVKAAYNHHKMNGLDKYDEYGILAQTYRHNPTDPVYNSDGTYYLDRRAFNYFNPVEAINEIDREINTGQLLTSLGVEYLITPDLKVILDGTYLDYRLESSLYKPEIDGFIPSGELKKETKEYNKQLTGSLSLSYNKNIKNLHWITAEIGYSYRNQRSEFLQGRGMDPYRYIVFRRDDNDTASINNSINSVFANVAYNFRKRYYIDAGIRYDALSPSIEKSGTLATDPEDLEGLGNVYPRIMVGWGISNENFLKGAKWLNKLMLGGGYGEAGKEYNFYTMDLNSRVDFEKSKEYNVMLDFGLWQNRLSGNITYYHRSSVDIFARMHVPIPPNIYPVVHDNSTEVVNKGVEINLFGEIVKSEKIAYSTSLTFSKNNNEIVQMFENAGLKHNFVDLTDYASYTQYFTQGQSLYAFYLPRFYDFYDHKMLFYENGGGYTYYTEMAERAYSNTVMPKFELSWGNYFKIYRNIDFSFSLRYVQGHSVYREAKMDLESIFAPDLNVLAESVNSEYFLPKVSDYYLHDASFLRLDNIAISYTFDLKSVTSASKLKLMLGANNLFTLTNFGGLDPEINYNTLYPGVEKAYVYPSMRSYFFSLSLVI